MKSLFSEMSEKDKETLEEALLRILTASAPNKRMSGRLMATGVLEKTYDWARAELENKCDPLDLLTACARTQDAMLTAVLMMVLDPRKLKDEAEVRRLARDTAEIARGSLEATIAGAIRDARRQQTQVQAQAKEAI